MVKGEVRIHNSPLYPFVGTDVAFFSHFLSAETIGYDTRHPENSYESRSPYNMFLHYEVFVQLGST